MPKAIFYLLKGGYKFMLGAGGSRAPTPSIATVSFDHIPTTITFQPTNR